MSASIEYLTDKENNILLPKTVTKAVYDENGNRLDRVIHNKYKAIADNWQGKGYNLIPFPYYRTSQTINSITWTVNSDGTITANGTAASTSIFRLSDPALDLPTLQNEKNYAVSALCDDEEGRIELYRPIGTSESITARGKQFIPFKYINTGYNTSINLYISAGVTVSNITFRPMLVEVADDGTYPTEYQRYAKGNVELTESINTISDAYNPSKTYAQGEFCIYNNTLWKSKVANNAGNTPTEGSYWTATNVGNELTQYVKIVNVNFSALSFNPYETKSNTSSCAIPSGYVPIGIFLNNVSAGLAYNSASLTNGNTQAIVSLSNWFNGAISGSCIISILCIKM